MIECCLVAYGAKIPIVPDIRLWIVARHWAFAMTKVQFGGWVQPLRRKLRSEDGMMKEIISGVIRFVLEWNRKYPVTACLVFLVASLVLMSAYALLTLGISEILGINEFLFVYFSFIVVSPLVPFMMISGMLMMEPIWMFFGIYHLFGIQRNTFRNSLSKRFESDASEQ